jgi:creatinine amidohydrolase
MVENSWIDLKNEIEKKSLVLLPTAVIEEHGPHLCLGVDALCSVLLCKLTKKELIQKKIETTIAPPLYWGINNATAGFPGSFTLRKETLYNLIIDILTSLDRWGFKKIFLLNWHGDKIHISTIVTAVKEARISFGVRAYIILSKFDINRLKLNDGKPYILKVEEPIFHDNKELNIHAGLIETSIMKRYYDQYLDEEKAKNLKGTDLKKDDIFEWNKGWEVTRNLIKDGYFGNPSEYNEILGEKVMTIKSKSIASQIKSFLEESKKLPKS